MTNADNNNNVNRSIDCRAIHSGIHAGSLTRFRPARPLHMLPFYHGRIRFDLAKKMLKKTNEYLLYTEATTSQLHLCVRDEAGAFHRPQIVRRPQALYGIDGRRKFHEQAFPNVEQLVTYYEVYGLPVKDDPLPSGKYVRLETRATKTMCNEEALPVEFRRPFKEPGDLDYFHYLLSKDEAEKRLIKVGDFLVRQDADKQAAFTLSARGADGNVQHHLIEREPNTGVSYLLPREDVNEPIESVYFLDELIRFHMLFSMALGGVRLINPVLRPTVPA